ncbi:MAG: hypothetical protein CVU42_10450 [Chloroflexi bacterium HGW-Chloroflexi-4]|jgi:hypothetical protein|nr:MAG: hypothetical protein CVU42_10450 [Chloroflexi bacterium HGW-Chloroflexi-4]
MKMSQLTNILTLITILGIAVITSGCLTIVENTSSGTNEEIIPISTVTIIATDTNINPILTPTMSTEENGGGLSDPVLSETVTDWWGIIKTSETGSQFDDYFERRDLGQPISFGIDSLDPIIKAQIEELRDSGKTVHLYGTIVSNAPDVNGSQILVDQIEVSDGAGGLIPPGTSEPISNWWGVIKSNPPGAQFDDYFERQDLGQIICFGIDSSDPVVKEQIIALRDSGTIVHLFGTLISNVPDFNGSQILVDLIE